jgi:hypothetical protein
VKGGPRLERIERRRRKAFTAGSANEALLSLCEAGLKFDLDKVDVHTRPTGVGKDCFSIKATGYVSALKIGGKTVLTECSAIQKLNLSPWRSICAYHRRIAKRPHVQAAPMVDRPGIAAVR